MPDSSHPSPYRIDSIPAVKQQIRVLGEQATDLGIREQFFVALRLCIERLREEPLAFGEPEYHTIHPGGTVCHGGCKPVFVRYAVYQQERLVVILRLTLLPPAHKSAT